MKTKRIVFTEPRKAELLICDTKPMTAESIVVKTSVSTVSAGTERANLLGNPNISIGGEPSVSFPRQLGYSSSGIITEVGEGVRNLKAGDRVALFGSLHSEYNVLHSTAAVKIPDSVTMGDGAKMYIATFPLAAIRKCGVEIGESALVMGLGILGQIAVQLLRCAGAAPIIAADLLPERREQALRAGADYALDPREPDFKERVKELTGGGAQVCIEVTGVGAGLDSALDCMARFGRVALLGCTRDKEFSIDYYRKVHGPGITLIGAHTNARPSTESHHGYYTHADDIRALLKLIELKRLDLSLLDTEIYSPDECGNVYERLAENRDFPTVAQFDWSLLDK